MLFQELVEDVMLANVELSADNASVVDTEDGVDVLHALCPDVG